MKKAIPIIIVLLIFLVGVGVLAYPLVSSMVNNFNTRNEAEQTIEYIRNKDTDEITQLFEDAERYNRSLLNTIILTDPFDEKAYEEIGENYRETFNVREDGLIGYVDIPKINVYLPIFHGTSSEVLEKGAGHLDNTAFPIGGESTHSVISAHSAYPGETFFDYLEEMKPGDEFYIHVLNRTLKYEVDEINVVTPDDTSKLFTIKGEDHVTLLTCTPYSINTHRLLVRGVRVPNDEKTEDKTKAISVDNNYIFILGYRISYLSAALFIVGFTSVVAGIVVFIVVRKRVKAKCLKAGDGDG